MQSQDPNPPKRQKLAQRNKEGDRAGSGGIDENIEDLDGHWEAGMSDMGQVFRSLLMTWICFHIE